MVYVCVNVRLKSICAGCVWVKYWLNHSWTCNFISYSAGYGISDTLIIE